MRTVNAPNRGDLSVSRRTALMVTLSSAATWGTVIVRPRPALATPEAMRVAMRAVTRDAPVQSGRVSLDIPPLVENGNAVPCTVTVQSPMTVTDFVRAIHVFNEKNPQPEVIHVKLGARAGRATTSFRMRLADTQSVVALAEMSDGSFWSATADVVVTLGACLEDPI